MTDQSVIIKKRNGTTNHRQESPKTADSSCSSHCLRQTRLSTDYHRPDCGNCRGGEGIPSTSPSTARKTSSTPCSRNSPATPSGANLPLPQTPKNTPVIGSPRLFTGSPRPSIKTSRSFLLTLEFWSVCGVEQTSTRFGQKYGGDVSRIPVPDRRPSRRREGPAARSLPKRHWRPSLHASSPSLTGCLSSNGRYRESGPQTP